MANRKQYSICLLSVIGLLSLAFSLNLTPLQVKFLPLTVLSCAGKDDPVHNYLSATNIERLFPSSSGKKHEFLLTMVISSPENKERRGTIRETWKNSYIEQGRQFDIKFVLGTFGLSDEDKRAIMVENQMYNDLVLLTHHLDSYNNLTMKVLSMLVWADLNMNYSYLLKADDDTFVRLDVIESELVARKSVKELYWGLFIPNVRPRKEGKWKEDNWYLATNYLPYAQGGGYVLSANLVHRIAINADGVNPYHNEDVSVGVWVSPYQFEQKHDKRFSQFASDKCHNSYISLHYQSTEDMRRHHRQLVFKGTLCE